MQRKGKRELILCHCGRQSSNVARTEILVRIQIVDRDAGQLHVRGPVEPERYVLEIRDLSKCGTTGVCYEREEKKPNYARSEAKHTIHC